MMTQKSKTLWTTLAVCLSLATAWLVVAKQMQTGRKGDKSGPSKTHEQTLRDSLQKHVGAHRVRAVWLEQEERKKPDQWGFANDYRLMGFDSEQGPCGIITQPGAVSRPLISPDGQKVIYSMRHTQPPEVRCVNWDGSNDVRLASGYAVDVVWDKQQKTTWVYALETINLESLLALDGTGLHRFSLTDPKTREDVWPHKLFAADNLQFSNDGRFFAAQFGWPHGRVGDAQNHAELPLGNGCWTSMAPDNSYLSWVFHGAHRKVQMQDLATGKKWSVSVSTAPGLDHQASYHPRWTNHPRFFVQSGPYPPRQQSKNKPRITKSGVEIYLGKFNAEMTKVEGWIKLTSDKQPDYFPDAWIEGGDDEVLEHFAQQPVIKVNKPTATVAVASTGKVALLLFLWDRAGEDNEISGREMSCRAEAKGIGRYGREGELLLDGGSFVLDDFSRKAASAELAKARALTLSFHYQQPQATLAEATVPVASLGNTGKPTFQLLRNPKRWSLLVAGKSLLEAESTAPGESVTLRVDPSTASLWLAGQQVVSVALPALDNTAWQDLALEWGGKPTAALPNGWAALVQNIVLLAVAQDEPFIAAQAKQPLAVAPAIVRHAVRARLLAATEPDLDELGSYTRALIDHTYEVTQGNEQIRTGTKVIVLHWAVLDRGLVPGWPRALGSEFDLLLEPADDHSEITSELQQTESDDLEATMYLDVSSPSPPALTSPSSR